MNAVETLQEARDFLMANQWTKGRFRDASGEAFCALGACHSVLNHHWIKDESCQGNWSTVELMPGGLLVYLTRALPEPFTSVPEFNDHHMTTFNDVMAVFDEAIRLAKEDAA